MKILVDSCVPRQIGIWLSKKHSVEFVTDLFGSISIPDEPIYQYAKRKDLILLTTNYKCFDDIGRFPLNKHPGAIVLKATNLTKYSTLLTILLRYHPNKMDYYQKRMLLNESQLITKTTRGTTVKNLDDLQPIKKRASHPRHKGG